MRRNRNSVATDIPSYQDTGRSTFMLRLSRLRCIGLLQQ
jgi:hypothetical protein